MKFPAIDDRAAASQRGIRARAYSDGRRSASSRLRCRTRCSWGSRWARRSMTDFSTAFVDGSGTGGEGRSGCGACCISGIGSRPGSSASGAFLAPGRILVTWSIPSHRYDRLCCRSSSGSDEDGCAVHPRGRRRGAVGADPASRTSRPGGHRLRRAGWRQEYERCWPLERTIRDGCCRYAFPDGCVRAPAVRAHDRQPNGSWGSCSSWRRTVRR